MNKLNFETILLDSCTSTMDEAKKFAQEKMRDHIFCVIAKQQTAGRGRGGSTWTQSDQQNSEPDFLPLTLVIPTNKLKIPLEWLSITVGCAIYDALKQTETFLKNTFSNIQPFYKENEFFIKWPNDIVTYPEGKKISGILCESSVLNGKTNEVFVGIGLNFFSHPNLENSTSFIDSRFSSALTTEFKQLILTHFIDVFSYEIEEYLLHSRSIEQLKHLALERFLPKGTYLSVNKGAMKGKFLTLGNNGALLLEGVNEPIFSGDVSIENHPPSHSSRLDPAAAPLEAPRDDKVKVNKAKVKPIIAIDFGNSRIHIANQNSKGSIQFIDHKYNFDFDTLKIELKPVLMNLIEDKTELISIFYCSVNTKEKTEESLANLISFFKKIFPEIKFTQIKITEKEVFEKSPILGDFDTQRLGTDRALKFYFAFTEAQKSNQNILVFSFGTAVTCEGVSKEGSILENFVCPGIQMSFNALHDYTALLPALIANPKLFSPEGKNWDQEIYLQRGVFMSVVGTILTTAKLHEPCLCFFSGGNGEQIALIIESIIKKTGFNIQYKIIENIETKMILEIANSSPTLTHPPKKIIEEQTKSIQTVLNSMMKSRILEKDRCNIPPRLEEFKRIGGRIENSDENRFDLYMAHKFKFYTREEWRERILNGEVLIEHGSSREINPAKKPFLNKQKPTYKIKNFDQIWLFRPPEYEPEFLDTIHAVYDNKDICIFAKPPNLVVHAAGLYLKNTFVEHIAQMGYENCSPVHRIDRETSGILICARKNETRKILSDAFRYSQVKKMYLAVTKGTRDLPPKFMVNLPIGEPENSLIRLKLWVNGKNSQPAATFFAKLSSVDDYTLFACLPITGRTNQIRIHLAAIGHWIVGDKMYYENEKVFIEFYEKGFTQWVHEQILFPRHTLHNTGIMLDAALNSHPLSFEPIICPIPEDMLEFPVVKELMKQANLPLQEEEQMNALKKLFLNLHEINFANEPIIS